VGQGSEAFSVLARGVEECTVRKGKYLRKCIRLSPLRFLIMSIVFPFRFINRYVIADFLT
jgi:hypothetical protein